jgi:hypothetical protein
MAFVFIQLFPSSLSKEQKFRASNASNTSFARLFLQTHYHFFFTFTVAKMLLVSTVLLGLLSQILAQSDPYAAATTDIGAPTGICNDEK